MAQLSKYLNYLYCDLSDLHPTPQRENQFYFDIQDNIIDVYFAKQMKPKGQAFDTLQRFI